MMCRSPFLQKVFEDIRMRYVCPGVSPERHMVGVRGWRAPDSLYSSSKIRRPECMAVFLACAASATLRSNTDQIFTMSGKYHAGDTVRQILEKPFV
jgi:hypothetical protein